MTMLTVRPESGRIHSPRFSNLIENIFDNDFPTFLGNEFLKTSGPSVNIKDTKDAYSIQVSAPGFAKENFSVKAEDGFLTIAGEAKEEKLEDGTKFTRKEFVHTSFKRSFTLPKTIVADKIGASYENGILTVTLPKLEEAKAKGTIEVKIS
ncbi:MAG TPA: Hsp20/alpha crystallin family protein [Chitinophagales bacterium]|nr:Hsp20/alpha crystallin family protein [Chitinophagales bacterium]